MGWCNYNGRKTKVAAKGKTKVAAKGKTKVAAKGKMKVAAKGRMSTKKKVDELHLPSLTIKRFRGFKEMHLPELGRVTLLTGENGVGKSTILEAAQIYASAGDPNIITNILENREDVVVNEDEDGDPIDIPNHGSLFFGYGEPEVGNFIEIGGCGTENTLRVELSNFEAKELENIPASWLSSTYVRDGFKCLAVSSGSDRKTVSKFPFFHSKERRIAGHVPPTRMPRRSWWSYRGINRRIKEQQIPYEKLGPGLPSNAKIASRYETVELTSEGERILDVLRFIKPSIERLASQGSRKYDVPRMMVKLKGADSPVPLKSMGDGIVHLLGLAVMLINAKGGLLLIDEVENGFHYSLFPKLWRFIMQTAQDNNAQVIAATHNWDCFKGFAQVARDMGNIEGRVIRIERNGEETVAIPYSEEEALVAAKSDIEVR